MNPQEIAQWPLAAILLAIGLGLGGLFLTGRFTLGRETDRALAGQLKAEQGEAELKAVVVSLTATVSAQGDQLSRLTTIVEKLTAAITSRTA